MTSEEIKKMEERELLLRLCSRFQREGIYSQARTFEGLKGEQKPHTLFIGCSDSWFATHADQQFGRRSLCRAQYSQPVPFYEIETKKFVAISAVIEYAVLELNVENIVVCGHSNCGGCGALYGERVGQTVSYEKMARTCNAGKRACGRENS